MFRIFVSGILTEDWGHVTSILLPHPKTGAKTMFLFDTRMEGVNEKKYFLFEVLTMVEEEGLS